MNKRGKTMLALVILLSLFAVLGGIYNKARPEPSVGEKQISVEVVHKDGSVKTFTYLTDMEYLGEVLLEDGLIEGDKGEFGIYILVVDGEQAKFEEDGAYWAFYQGEEYASQSVDLTPICDGDSFRLVYTYG